MPNPYGPILSQLKGSDGTGFLEGGKLGPAGRKKYVEEVIGLLTTGNKDGFGGIGPLKGVFGLVPLPPAPGPTIFNVTTLAQEPLFWFGPDPVAAALATMLVDPTATPVWNAIFPDLIYGKTAAALDLNGNTPLFPFFDVSVAFDVKGFPIALPDLAIKANIMPLPKLLIKLADLGIQLSLPSIPVPPIPPSIDIPSLDLALPLLKLDIGLFSLIVGLIKLPFDLIAALLLPPDLGLVLDLIQFKFGALIDLAFKIIIPLLAPFLPIVPKLLIASLLIYIKDVVAMVATDLIGMLVGAGGSLTTAVAAFTGLIT